MSQNSEVVQDTSSTFGTWLRQKQPRIKIQVGTVATLTTFIYSLARVSSDRPILFWSENVGVVAGFCVQAIAIACLLGFDPNIPHN